MSSRLKMYYAWWHARNRCTNEKSAGYVNYGARGITMCELWSKDFETFYTDMAPTWKENLQLDRINVDGPYSPENCRWSTASENMKNRRNKAKIQSKYEGVTWHPQRKSWKFDLRGHGFKTEEEAFAVYSKLKDYLKSIS